MNKTYCSLKTCKGCPLFKKDTYGNCKTFVKESKQNAINRRNSKGNIYAFQQYVWRNRELW